MLDRALREGTWTTVGESRVGLVQKCSIIEGVWTHALASESKNRPASSRSVLVWLPQEPILDARLKPRWSAFHPSVPGFKCSNGKSECGSWNRVEYHHVF